MSGFVAVCNWDGRPVERKVLLPLAASLRTRGPAGGAVRVLGSVGLVFRALTASAGAMQPRTLDDAVWIVGDIRLDGRNELRRLLADSDCRPGPETGDADLVLHAYTAWGEDCLQHLLGDFSLVIWDGRRRQLLAARDQFGVRPLYYAEVGACLLVSNTLNCLRRYPGVSQELNELAIGDFLLFGFNQEPETTTFAAIRRLPPAHVLVARGQHPRVRRYWELSCEPGSEQLTPTECVEKFCDLLRIAVSDRLHAPQTALLMSGGMDSTAIAALAQELGRTASPSIACQAFTHVFDEAIPDQERHYATLAGQGLGLPVCFLPADRHRLFDLYPSADALPEPADEPMPTMQYDTFGRVAEFSPVVLTGFGADPLLRGSPAYMMGLLKKLRWGRWLKEFVSFVWAQRSLPPLGLRGWVKSLVRREKPPPLPDWLNSEFVRHADLPRRWETYLRPLPLRHPTHAEAYRFLTGPFWPSLFEFFDAGVTGQPLDVRHPFFDVRLVNFVFSLPPLPWCANKHLLREAMRGLLPEVIRQRPKRPLAGDPVASFLRRSGKRWADYFDAKPPLRRYVDIGRVRQATEDPAAVTGYLSNLLWRPLCLNYWFAYLESHPLSFLEEDADDCCDPTAHEEDLPPAEAYGVRDRP